MHHIFPLKVSLREAVTAFAPWMEPTDAELDAIEAEMPLILADIDLADAHIIALDRTPSELDERRIRRARRQALAARAALATRARQSLPLGAA
ncbi:hypothetical protein H8N01_09300 [Streptomyces sp. AC536]|uniref:DUF6284 family protein n=1 Tax=Streptomyces buecherae TaxID=2763006 RepID=UPI00164DDFF3|nr:DUF6284 family protein [Streptomyces buecherae]MBC3982756.1 hypothetical protein [Streptomyces buecherae]QNJ41323.1 hypothetical protein H7H31_17055 [Streptomyces buecherae]